MIAKVEAVNLGLATVRLAENGTRLTNLSTIGGPVNVGDQVVVDYSAGTPPFVRPEFLETETETVLQPTPATESEPPSEPIEDLGCMVLMDYEQGPPWYDFIWPNVPTNVIWRDNIEEWTYAEVYDTSGFYNHKASWGSTDFKIPKDGKYLIVLLMNYCNIDESAISSQQRGYTYVEITKNNIPVARTACRWDEFETSYIMEASCITIEPCKRGDIVRARLWMNIGPMNPLAYPYFLLDYDTNYGNAPIFQIQYVNESNAILQAGGGFSPPPVPPDPSLPPDEQPPPPVPLREKPWIQKGHMRVQPDGLGYTHAYLFGGYPAKDHKDAYMKSAYGLYPTADMDDLFPTYQRMDYPLDTRAGVEDSWAYIDDQQTTGTLAEYISGYGLGTITGGNWMLQGDIKFEVQTGFVCGMTSVYVHFYKKKDNGTETLIYEGLWFAVSISSRESTYEHYPLFLPNLSEVVFDTDERLLMRFTWSIPGPYYSPYARPDFKMMIYNGGHSFVLAGTSWEPKTAKAAKHAFMPVLPFNVKNAKSAYLCTNGNFASFQSDADRTLYASSTNWITPTVVDYDPSGMKEPGKIVIRESGIYQVVGHVQVNMSAGPGAAPISYKLQANYIASGYEQHTLLHQETIWLNESGSGTFVWTGPLTAGWWLQLGCYHTRQGTVLMKDNQWSHHLVVRRLE